MHFNTNRTTPIGLSRYAREFFDCAMTAYNSTKVKPGHEIITPVPILYLAGHSIELSLKSFLVYKGVLLKDLPTNKYGHNLLKCLKKAKELGLDSIVNLNNVEMQMLELLNELYCSKQLNYIVTGSKQYPLFGPIQKACQKLLEGIGPKVGYK